GTSRPNMRRSARIWNSSAYTVHPPSARAPSIASCISCTSLAMSRRGRGGAGGLRPAGVSSAGSSRTRDGRGAPVGPLQPPGGQGVVAAFGVQREHPFAQLEYAAGERGLALAGGPDQRDVLAGCPRLPPPRQKQGIPRRRLHLPGQPRVRGHLNSPRALRIAASSADDGTPSTGTVAKTASIIASKSTPPKSSAIFSM